MRLQDLPGAARSSRVVAGLLGTTAIVGDKASESEVRRRLPHASVAYLATHAYVFDSPDSVNLSFIALKSNSGSADDGFLTVDEVLSDELPDLSLDLLALSACETGLGQVTASEGTVGLQRAFFARGVRSILVSSWNVDDDASEVLLNEFFRQWRVRRLSKAEALRQAQRAVWRNPAWRAPRFWAAYQIAGAR
jgi:CHAT domain-containing protein